MPRGDGVGVLGGPGLGVSPPLPPASPLCPGSIRSCCLGEVCGDQMKPPGRFVFTEKPLCREKCFYYYCYYCFSLGNKLVTQPATCIWILMLSCENLTPRNFAAAIQLPPSMLWDGWVPLGGRGAVGPSPQVSPPGQGCFVWYLRGMGFGAGS